MVSLSSVGGGVKQCRNTSSRKCCCMQTGGSLPTHPLNLAPLEKHLGGEICLWLWGLGYLTHPAEMRWISPGFTEKGNALTTQHNNFTLCDLLRFKICPLNFCSSQILSLFFFSLSFCFPPSLSYLVSLYFPLEISTIGSQ